MMKLIFSIAFLSLVCAARVFSMDIMTEHKMKSVVIQIASNTVDQKKDPKASSNLKDGGEVKSLEISHDVIPEY